jgi:hypothetical protein
MTKFTGQKYTYNLYITNYTILYYYVLLLHTKAVLVCSEAVDVEVKVNETKDVVTSGKQNAGQCHNIRLGALFTGKFHVCEWHEQIQLHEKKALHQVKFKDSLLVMGPESDSFPFPV